MTKVLSIESLIIWLGLANLVSSFTSQDTARLRSYNTALGMSSPPDVDDEEPRLVLGNVEAEMQSVRANSDTEYDFGAIDFLAAAKARAAAKVESNNNVAGDEAWQKLAEEKKEQLGEIDDWENSKKEAGNEDSQILMFTGPPEGEEGEGGDGEDDEPKLLLL